MTRATVSSRGAIPIDGVQERRQERRHPHRVQRRAPRPLEPIGRLRGRSGGFGFGARALVPSRTANCTPRLAVKISHRHSHRVKVHDAPAVAETPAIFENKDRMAYLCGFLLLLMHLYEIQIYDLVATSGDSSIKLLLFHFFSPSNIPEIIHPFTLTAIRLQKQPV